MRLKIKNIFAVLFVVSALSSCDDALDKFPLDSLSPETFFSNETELQAYSNAFYGCFPGNSLYNSTDDLIVNYQLDNIMLGARGLDAGSWSWGYLRNFNTLIEYSKNCKDEAVRTKYVALARFFRGYFYFEKVKQFGDVPWTDKALGSGDPELYKPRDNREFVMTKILADLDYAIEHLSATRESYRVTKWTALALKSRVCLFEGTFRKYHAGAEMLQTLPADANGYEYYLNLAAAAADEFITSSGYRLYTEEGTKGSYRGLFAQNSVTDGTNVEIILARNYNLAYDATHSAGNYITSSTMGMPGMTKKFVNSYLMKDGSRYTDQEGWETKSFVEEVKNRDPRFSQSIRTPGFKRYGTDEVLPIDIQITTTGYSPVKYWTDAQSERYNEGDLDLVIFRAAEVYLNYAEAKAELGTLTQADLDKAIKPIRDRVGMPNMNLTTLTVDPYLTDRYTGYPNAKGDQLAAILEIRRERTIELIQEGHRYYDIVRWAEGATLETPLQGLYFAGPGNYDLDGDGKNDITLYEGDEAPSGDGVALIVKKISDKNEAGTIILSNGNSGYYEHHKNSRPTFKWNEGRDYLYAIPIDERSLTDGALTQNPGWDDGLSFE